MAVSFASVAARTDKAPDLRHILEAADQRINDMDTTVFVMKFLRY